MCDGIDNVEPEVVVLQRLVDQARGAVAAGDRTGFARVATAILRRIQTPFVYPVVEVTDVVAAMDALPDTAFPPPPVDGSAPPVSDVQRTVLTPISSVD